MQSEDTMTKTIEEQIAEARAEQRAPFAAIEGANLTPDDMDALERLSRRAASRLATLEAVRDGRMVEAWATVCVSPGRGWVSHGRAGDEPTHEDVLTDASHEPGDAVTILRGYAHVPSTQVHEVEADSEVVL